MKVRELVNQLNKLDPDLEVYCYEEGPVAINGPGPFDVTDAAIVPVELNRLNGKPAMHFGSAPNARQVVILGITPDF